MNNEMDDFSSKPGYPNTYGLIVRANKIEHENSLIVHVSCYCFQK